MTVEWKSISRAQPLRLPLEGQIDLTFRCNNDCRHCWIRGYAPSVGDAELSLEEIRDIAGQARRMGCRYWCVSGGEPMLRPDFPEIFKCLTERCIRYMLNTNGTLITPQIARLLGTRNGSILVALYGATADVHDHVTRTTGSFDLTLRGMARLREAGTPFAVQIVPMRANDHQYDRMLTLARQLSPFVKIGAPWLYLSASGDEARNREILEQRLAPERMVDLSPPDVTFDDLLDGDEPAPCALKHHDDRLFAGCISTGNRFYVDPYGHMSFCCFAQDPRLQYDLRKGSFAEGWENFIPSIAETVQGSVEYAENCGSCGLRDTCHWCPMYAYLEHRRYPAKIEYLCAAAREMKTFRDQWRKDHRRYFRIAGITVRVDSDLPFRPDTLEAKFKPFEAGGPGADTVTIRHHFALPPLKGRDLGQIVYDRSPWRVYRKGRAWIYLCGAGSPEPETAHQVAVFSDDYSRARIYHSHDRVFRRGDVNSVTFFATDQIYLAQLLARREGCYVHSSGLILNGKGLLFAGHAEAGKSTAMKIMKPHAEWVTDDRMIVRRWPDGFRMHGSWSHGELPQTSPASAPLAGILFLEKAAVNRIDRIEDRKTIVRRLIPLIIKPLTTPDWWDRTLALVARIAGEVPCYLLHFDRSGEAARVLEDHFP